jgi:hypothetical protein
MWSKALQFETFVEYLALQKDIYSFAIRMFHFMNVLFCYNLSMKYANILSSHIIL